MISRKQFNKLRSIAFFGGTTAKDYSKRKCLYDYLHSNDLIRTEEVRGYSGYTVTEKGYAEMYAFRTEHYRFWFPSVVSVLALITSILTLATANPAAWQGVLQVLEEFLSAFRG